MFSKVTVLSSAIGAALLAGTAMAGSIGLNYADQDAAKQAATTLAPTDTTGVEAQSHWNNITKWDSTSPPTGKLTSITDDQGKVIDGMTATYKAPAGQEWRLGSGASWGFSGNDLKLMQGMMHLGHTLTITKIPYAKYKVIVYTNAGDNGGQGDWVQLAVAGGPGSVDTKQHWYKSAWTDGNFKEATGTDKDSATGGNYVVIDGNTAPNITLTANGGVNGGWTGVSAVQIVEVK